MLLINQKESQQEEEEVRKKRQGSQCRAERKASLEAAADPPSTARSLLGFSLRIKEVTEDREV